MASSSKYILWLYILASVHIRIHLHHRRLPIINILVWELFHDEMDTVLLFSDSPFVLCSCWITVTMIDGKCWDEFEVIKPPSWEAYISQLLLIARSLPLSWWKPSTASPVYSSKTCLHDLKCTLHKGHPSCANWCSYLTFLVHLWDTLRIWEQNVDWFGKRRTFDMTSVEEFSQTLLMTPYLLT